MSKPTVREIVKRRRKEYLRASKSQKKRMLDELEVLIGYHRKSLVRMFGDHAEKKKAPARQPRASKYEPIRPQLRVLWAMALYACGRRLRPFIDETLSGLMRFGEMSPTTREESLLRLISASTIDRMLAPERASLTIKGRTTTKPGTLLRSQIPVRTFAEWTENEPGFFELDLVGHCGGSVSGEFLYTLNMTDVFSGWIALGAMKGERRDGNP